MASSPPETNLRSRFALISTTSVLPFTFSRLVGRLNSAGQFYRLHNLAIDSRGNLYTTEVNVGQHLQKFDRVGG